MMRQRLSRICAPRRRRLISWVINLLVLVDRPLLRRLFARGDASPGHPRPHPILLPMLLVVILLLLPGPPTTWELVGIFIGALYHGIRFLQHCIRHRHRRTHWSQNGHA